MTAAKCYRLLRTVLAAAVEDESITRNPCTLKGAGVEHSAERPIATVDEVFALASTVAGGVRRRSVVNQATTRQDRPNLGSFGSNLTGTGFRKMNSGLGRQKESFDRVADDYAAFRTTPPREVFDALVEASGVRTGSRVLEIGCGTGQLSVPLADLGVELIAVELGPRLAALARRNLEQYPQARVLVSSFEEWQLPDRKFDAVICASAFHWLDPEVRYAKSAAALHPGGALALLQLHYVRGGTDGFFADTQQYYRRWGLSDDPMFDLPDPHELPASYPALDGRLEFRDVERYRFEIPMRHTTASYVGWLRTDSLVNSLDANSRAKFLAEMERLIALRYHGAVERNLLYELIVAKRLP